MSTSLSVEGKLTGNFCVVNTALKSRPNLSTLRMNKKCSTNSSNEEFREIADVNF